MGIFSHFREQEERLEALEQHVRLVTEAVQQNQIDIAAGLLALVSVQVQLDEKVAMEDVDPAIREMNEKLGVAREKFAEAKDAAGESWLTLQDGMSDALRTLRSSVDTARDRLTQD